MDRPAPVPSDVSFVEWRPAEAGAYDFVRNTGAEPVALTFNGYAY